MNNTNLELEKSRGKNPKIKNKNKKQDINCENLIIQEGNKDTEHNKNNKESRPKNKKRNISGSIEKQRANPVQEPIINDTLVENKKNKNSKKKIKEQQIKGILNNRKLYY